MVNEMALKGIRVLELAGLAPAPFCGMILSDFGATVTRIDRMAVNPIDCLSQGKRTIAVNLKNAKGQELVRKLSKVSDVLIEPYRPGVMEKLNLSPEDLLKENPRLIYARLTGFGQTGPLAKRAGHDINYIALSGVLSLLGKHGEPPTPPTNLIADFAGGGLLCAFGILAAIVERNRSGIGQIIDSSMVEGAAYVGSWLTRSQTLPLWGNNRGGNFLDGGAFFYSVYETKDGKFMSVGALEPQFFTEFINILGVDGLDQSDAYSAVSKKKVEEAFKTKTQQEWNALFENTDACVYPVLDWQNADQHPHNKHCKTFVPKEITNSFIVPSPAPKLSRTPASSGVYKSRDHDDDYGKQVEEICKEVDLNANDIEKLIEEGALISSANSKL